MPPARQMHEVHLEDRDTAQTMYAYDQLRRGLAEAGILPHGKPVGQKLIHYGTRNSLEDNSENGSQLAEHFDRVLEHSKAADELIYRLVQHGETGTVHTMDQAHRVRALTIIRDHLLNGAQAFVDSQKNRLHNALILARRPIRVYGEERKREKNKRREATVEAREIRLLLPQLKMMERRIRHVREYFEGT